jgi:hypothetical protein
MSAAIFFSLHFLGPRPTLSVHTNLLAHKENVKVKRNGIAAVLPQIKGNVIASPFFFYVYC